MNLETRLTKLRELTGNLLSLQTCPGGWVIAVRADDGAGSIWELGRAATVTDTIIAAEKTVANIERLKT